MTFPRRRGLRPRRVARPLFSRQSVAFLLAAALLAFGATSDSLLPLTPTARAATFTVSNTNDGGAGSLRQAITSANAAAGTDTITFDIAGAGPHTIQLASKLPDLEGSVNILNTSGEVVIVRGEGAADPYRIFVIPGGGLTVSISGLNLTNGSARIPGAELRAGGAIFNNGSTLTLTDCAVTGSTAEAGGGIRNFGALNMTGCVVSGNSADSGGGIFHTGGTATLTDCTVSDNFAGGFGGGIANGTSTASTLNLTNSTVSRNSVGGFHGGGIHNPGGTLNLTNSTFSGNSAVGDGGGIYTHGPAGNVTLTGVTVTDNRADSDGNATGTGGGVHIFSGAPLLRSTIVADNYLGAVTSAEDDIAGTAADASQHNLVGTGGGGLTGANNNQVGVSSPGLLPLANYGGRTETHRPRPGSPAIDRGNAFGSTTDQRGAGFPRVVGAAADVGAVEGPEVAPPAAITASAGTPQSATINTAFATALQATVTDGSGAPVAGVTVTFNAPASGPGGTFANGTATTDATTNASGVATATTFTANGTAGGPYNVTAGVGGGTLSTAFSLTNMKADQTITFGVIPGKTFGAAPFDVSANGGASGNPVTFTSRTTTVCTVSGNTVTILAGGTCTIRASQAGNGNYNAAADVERSFAVAPAATTTAVNSSPNPSGVGEGVLHTATVTSAAGTPTGVVRFLADGVLYGPTGVPCVAGDGNGCTAELRATPLPAGNHAITAEYLGNSDFAASAGTLAGGQTVVAGGVFQFAQGLYTVAERGGSVTVRVVRNGDPALPVAVDYTTDDGSTPAVFAPCSATAGLASERCDYTRAAGTLHFAAGESEQTFVVPVNDDSYAEGTETAQLRLSNPAGGAALASTHAATLEITDDAAESAGNPADDNENFVRQHYHDFLNREPDASGLAFWTGQMTDCGSPNLEVCRVNVSAAFFQSIEFQNTGYFVERMYKAAYGDATGNSTFGGAHQLAVPFVRLGEFLRDTQEIGRGVVVGQGAWQQQLATSKEAFAVEFVRRPEFLARYPAQSSASVFVSLLDQNAGGVLSPSERETLVSELSPNPSDAALRASVLRKVAEDSDLLSRESNRAFVLMQYFGYLRRNPDDAPDNNHTGYEFWLTKLNEFDGNFVNAEMVKAFISSTEYRSRFGRP